MNSDIQSRSNGNNRLVIGISGASGITYGIEALKQLRQLGIETHLVVSKSAMITLAHETDLKVADLHALADVTYVNADIGAAIASGSFPVRGMLVVPCSIKSMSEIATGVTSSLLSRAADVNLKERRRVVLMVRETPLHAGHLQNMLSLSQAGAIIAPPVPAFYTRPTSIEEIVTQSVARCLELFAIANPDIKRWS